MMSLLLGFAILLGNQAIRSPGIRELAEILDMDTDPPSESATPKPSHVTRLHRYDHSGPEAVVQAEARWLAATDEAPSPSVPAFVQLSAKQMEWLQEHHAQVMAQSHQTVSLHAQRTSPSGPAITRMSSLASQYVGPLNIGTVTSPAGCAGSQAASLLYLPKGDASSQVQTCHIEEQSQIWAVFDTGSTNLWVSSDLCIKGPCTKKERRRYNHSLSQTYASPQQADRLHVQFGTGALTGPMAVDDFHIGPFTVYNQTFAMIQEQTGAVFEQVPFEGILGLAFPSMSANGVTPFFDNVVQQKALKSNSFAFYFSLNNPSANAIFWGGWDSKFHEGGVEYFKVVDEYYWSLALKSFQIGGHELLGDGTPTTRKGSVMLQSGSGSADAPRPPRAIIDTGTTLFTASGATFAKVMERVPPVPCKEMNNATHPMMLFRLENEDGDLKDFELKNTQYMTADSTGSQCSPGFMKIDIPKEHGPGLIFGEIFLRHFFAVFDRRSGGSGDSRVGFARAAHGKGVDQHLKDLTKTQPVFGATSTMPERM